MMIIIILNTSVDKKCSRMDILAKHGLLMLDYASKATVILGYINREM